MALLRIKNPVAYKDLKDYLLPYAGEKMLDKSMLPANSACVGIWKCSKCRNLWMSTIAYRQNINTDPGCRICANHDDKTARIKILEFDYNYQTDGRLIRKITVYDTKSYSISEIIDYDDEINIDHRFTLDYDSETIKELTLKNKYPELSKLWADSYGITSDRIRISMNSEIKFKWKCLECKDTYQNTFKSVYSQFPNCCPYCFGRMPHRKESLGYKHPELQKRLIKDLHRGKNLYETFENSDSGSYFMCPNCGVISIISYKDLINNIPCQYCKDGMNKEETKYIYQGFGINKFIDRFNPESNTVQTFLCNKCGRIINVKPKDMFHKKIFCLCQNSFEHNHPDLMKEWDYNANYLLGNPDKILDTSTEIFWWRCNKNNNHKYTMSIQKRILYKKREKVACPYCKGMRMKEQHFIY